MAFLDLDVKVGVMTPDDPQMVIEHLSANMPAPLSLPEVRTVSAHMVRRGLPRGSPLSPLLAAWFIDQTLVEALTGSGVVVAVYLDNLAIGGPSAAKVVAAVNLLSEKLSEGPGTIELHDTEVMHKSKVDLLGYRLEAGKGYRGNPVHVKPGKRRIERKKAKLKGKLEEAQADGLDLDDTAEDYWNQWSPSQGAWTRVPYHSDRVSLDITMSYVNDFRDGIPMGCWKVNKPPVASIP